MKKHALKLSAIGVAAVLASASASADGIKNLLDVLLENGTISATEYQQLVSEAKSSDFKIEQKDGIIKFKSGDGAFELHVRGRLQADGYITTDGAGTGGAGSDRAFDDARFRRARIGVEGKLYKDWKYVFEVDFAGDEVTIEDANISYGGLKKLVGFPLNIKVGRQKEGTGLEQLTSSRFVTFLERAAATEAFEPSRSIGASINTHGDEKQGWSYFVGAGVFGEDGIDGTEGGSRDSSIGYGGRIVALPLIRHDESGKRITKLVHIGGSVNHRDLQEDQAGNAFGDFNNRYRARPGLRVLGDGGTRIIDTGTIAGVEDRSIYGAEAAVVWDSFSVQGEYFASEQSRPNGLSDPDFNGYYVQASWFPTGESRGYKASSATFDRVKVLSPLGKGGYGAWEIAARWEEVNLNDVAAGVEGGRVEGYTVGVNWYPTNNLRFSANYIDYNRDDDLNGTDVFAPGDIDEPIGVRAVGLRAQVDW